MIAANTMARKAHGFFPGSVTEVIIRATEGDADAVERRVQQSMELLQNGHSISEVVKGFEDTRKKTVEDSASAIFTGRLGKDVQIRVERMEPGARLPIGINEYYGFDLNADVEVTIR